MGARFQAGEQKRDRTPGRFERLKTGIPENRAQQLRPGAIARRFPQFLHPLVFINPGRLESCQVRESQGDFFRSKRQLQPHLEALDDFADILGIHQERCGAAESRLLAPLAPARSPAEIAQERQAEWLLRLPLRARRFLGFRADAADCSDHRSLQP